MEPENVAPPTLAPVSRGALPINRTLYEPGAPPSLINPMEMESSMGQCGPGLVYMNVAHQRGFKILDFGLDQHAVPGLFLYSKLKYPPGQQLFHGYYFSTC